MTKKRGPAALLRACLRRAAHAGAPARASGLLRPHGCGSVLHSETSGPLWSAVGRTQTRPGGAAATVLRACLRRAAHAGALARASCLLRPHGCGSVLHSETSGPLWSAHGRTQTRPGGAAATVLRACLRRAAHAGAPARASCLLRPHGCGSVLHSETSGPLCSAHGRTQTPGAGSVQVRKDCNDARPGPTGWMAVAQDWWRVQRSEPGGWSSGQNPGIRRRRPKPSFCREEGGGWARCEKW